MQSKVLKVKKTTDSWKTPGGKELFVHLVAMENGDKGWTFSEKFVEGEEIEYDKTDSKKVIDNTWYDHKLNPVKKEFTPGQKSPEQQRSIVRQHSQEMALRFFEIQATLGEVKRLSFSDVAIMADQFEKDAGGAEVKIEPKEVKEEEPSFDDIPF